MQSADQAGKEKKNRDSASKGQEKYFCEDVQLVTPDLSLEDKLEW